MGARPAAVVLLNPAAGGGRALARWARIEAAVREVCTPRVVVLGGEGAWRLAVRGAIEEGTRFFIAAGGDGTVSALVNALVGARGTVPLGEFLLGAVGLGSSNDFHKPYGRMVAGVPVRLAASSGSRDVCVARFVTAAGDREETCFVTSASIGLVAEANAFFNDGDTTQRWLKPRSTGGAILHAALRTIARHRNVRSRLRANGRSVATPITNLSLSKTPFVSGAFRYDTAVSPDDGLLSVQLCEGMSRAEAVGALLDLARGRFAARPKRRHWRTQRVGLALEGVHALELDGEVRMVRRVFVGVLSEKVRVCC